MEKLKFWRIENIIRLREISSFLTEKKRFCTNILSQFFDVLKKTFGLKQVFEIWILNFKLNYL